MKLYTCKTEFLQADKSNGNTFCIFESTIEPTDELAIQGLKSLSRKSKVFGVTPKLLGKMTDSTGKSKYIYYYSLQDFFDENLIAYSIFEFHCNKHQKVIATLGRLFHELIEQTLNVQGNNYDLPQLINVYESYFKINDISFTEFVESPHFLESMEVNRLINY